MQRMGWWIRLQSDRGRRWFGPIQRVKERLSRGNLGAFLGDGDGKHPDLVVVRQRESSLVSGKVDRIGEKVRVLVGFVQPIGGVMVRGIPCQACGLDISGGETKVILWII
jgi:hypothetical protein